MLSSESLLKGGVTAGLNWGSGGKMSFFGGIEESVGG